MCKRKRHGEEGLAHIDEVTRIHVEDIPATSLGLGLDVVPKGDEVTVIGIQPRRVVRVPVPIDPPAKQELGVNPTRPLLAAHVHIRATGPAAPSNSKMHIAIHASIL